MLHRDVHASPCEIGLQLLADSVAATWKYVAGLRRLKVRPEDMPFIPCCTDCAMKVVVYGPLALIPVVPDVVLLFVKADQTLILSEASQQLENGLPPAMGRPACGVIPQAFNTGRTALSLGCCGARAYLDVLTPDVALYAIPGSKLEAFTERVASLAQANSVLTQFHTLRRRDAEAGKRRRLSRSRSQRWGESGVSSLRTSQRAYSEEIRFPYSRLMILDRRSAGLNLVHARI